MANKLRKLELSEVSLVDKGANQHAHIVLMKRADDVEKIYASNADLPAAVKRLPDHGQSIYRAAFNSAYKEYAGDESKSHATAWAAVKQKFRQADDGSWIAKSEGVEMTEAEIAALKKRAEDAEAAFTKANVLAKLSDDEKQFLKTLGEPAQVDFLKADPAARGNQMAAARAQNEIIYTSTDGETFRKSDDPRLVAMAKRLDAERTAGNAAREAAELERLAKQARDEFPLLPGTDEEKAKVLKRIGALPEADRAAEMAMLKSGQEHAANSAYFTKVGSHGAPAGGAEAQLDTLAKRMVADKGAPTYEQAYTKVLETPEGARLYDQMSRN